MTIERHANTLTDESLSSLQVNGGDEAAQPANSTNRDVALRLQETQGSQNGQQRQLDPHRIIRAFPGELVIDALERSGGYHTPLSKQEIKYLLLSEKGFSSDLIASIEGKSVEIVESVLRVALHKAPTQLKGLRIEQIDKYKARVVDDGALWREQQIEERFGQITQALRSAMEDNDPSMTIESILGGLPINLRKRVWQLVVMNKSIDEQALTENVQPHFIDRSIRRALRIVSQQRKARASTLLADVSEEQALQASEAAKESASQQ